MSYSGTQSVSGFGVTFSINTGTFVSPTWTPVGEVQDISLSGRKNQTATATNLQSTFEEFIATIPAPGSYAITYNYVATDAGQAALEAAFEAASTVQLKLQLPKSGTQTSTGNSYVFKAIVEENNFPDTMSPTKILTGKTTLKISGPATVTAGS